MTALTIYPFSVRESPSVQALSGISAYRAQCQLGAVEIEVKNPDLVKFDPAAGPSGTYELEAVPVYENAAGETVSLSPIAVTLDLPNSVWELVPDPTTKHVENDGVLPLSQEKFGFLALHYALQSQSTTGAYSTLKIDRISLRGGGTYDIDGDWKQAHPDSKHNAGFEFDLEKSLSSDEEDVLTDVVETLVGEDFISTESIPSGSDVIHIDVVFVL